ncbi:unnamed protein product [Microthlaspi erraticum]|uniref:Extensin domain-containing protein n=1 Tax=Microthlaspi erraticum TaxID=1685480 RepID=A0A6D2JWX9_9BRAS|nr:unnamed protein product [Microthlaspi erraticum]
MKKMIMKLSTVTMMVTLFLLASGLASARVMNLDLPPRPYRPRPWPTEPLPPPPKRDAKKSVEQAPIPIFCPPGTPGCPPPRS